ncbi:MAG: 3-dehydroquinate synthase [Marvinbryantia sp.]|uniref:3-dehydroquinate synthase n=1 Tax=Marvinbryantia sp. TaxID=2496532 RepID=UPI0025E5C656|nr:3-dehydroquinate synthase [uncultured Marvinbryantia sp.]
MAQEKEQKNALTVKTDRAGGYTIYFEHDFGRLAEVLESDCGISGRKLCIVTDTTVEGLYLQEVIKALEGKCRALTQFVFPAGEQSKTLDTVRSLYEKLILEHFERRDMLIALGGGVVGDLTGFAAATYLRGIAFAQVPTTLLAQVDSSIGGKTGVDFDSYKNMVGAFHQPSLVYMNAHTLSTLPEEQFACGMGEVLKHGLIRSAAYYTWLIEHISEIAERDADTLQEMVMESCRIKRAVVEKDPTEKGERALLNFGHTIGHAIEKVKSPDLLHGQCVALGCVAAAYISFKRGLLSTEEFYEIRDMNVGFDLLFSVEDIDPQEILTITKSDKKMDQGSVKFVLLKKIGKAFIDTTVTDEEILEAVNFILYTETND